MMAFSLNIVTLFTQEYHFTLNLCGRLILSPPPPSHTKNKDIDIVGYFQISDK